MSLPENENLELNQDQEIKEEKVAENENEDGLLSTIFSDPAHYNDEPRVKKEKSKYSSLVKILAALLAVGIAVGAYFAIDRLVPEPEEEQQSAGIVIDVMTVSPGAVKKINIKNENSEYTILQNTVVSAGESTTVWWLDGVDASYTDSSLIEDVADVVLDLDAVREVPDADGDYGFDNPTVKVEVVGDGEKLNDYTVVIGDNAPGDLGCYCKIEGQDKVYIIDSQIMLSLQTVPLDFAVTTGYPGVTIDEKNVYCFGDSGIMKFDYISISGAAYGQTVTIKEQNDDSINAYFAYMITSPTKRIADDDKVSILLNYFNSGVSSVGAYSYKATKEELKKYKLDKPEFEVTISLNGQKNTFKFSKIDNLYCALLDGKTDMIHKVPISTLAISKNEIKDYYSTFIILETLSGLSEMKVKTPDGKQYNFDLKYTAADDENNVSQKYQAFYKGKELDVANFKRYYQKMIALTPITHESKSGLKTVASITLVHSAGTKDVVLTFKKYSSARYQVELDGIPMGLITATDFDQLMGDTPKVAADETIN